MSFLFLFGNTNISGNFDSVWTVWSLIANSSSQMEFDLAAIPPPPPKDVLL